MSKKQKNKLSYRGISAILLLLCIIVGGWLYTNPSKKVATTVKNLLLDETLAKQQDPSTLEKPAKTTPNDKPQQTSPTKTNAAPNKPQPANVEIQVGSSLQEKLVVMVIGAIAVVFCIAIRAVYKKYISSNASKQIDPNITLSPNEVKNTKTSKETKDDRVSTAPADNVSSDVKKEDEVLKINTAELDSLSATDGDNPFTQVLTRLEELSNANFAGKLIIILDTKDKDYNELNPSISENCKKLVTAIKECKEKTKCTVIVLAKKFIPKNYYIAAMVGDGIGIKPKGEIVIPVVCLCCLYPDFKGKNTQNNNESWKVYKYPCNAQEEKNERDALVQQYLSCIMQGRRASKQHKKSTKNKERINNLLIKAWSCRQSDDKDNATFTSLGDIAITDAYEIGLIDFRWKDSTS